MTTSTHPTSFKSSRARSFDELNEELFNGTTSSLPKLLDKLQLSKEEAENLLHSEDFASHRELRTYICRQILRIQAQDVAGRALNTLINLTESNHPATQRLAATQILNFAGLNTPHPLHNTLSQTLHTAPEPQPQPTPQAHGVQSMGTLNATPYTHDFPLQTETPTPEEPQLPLTNYQLPRQDPAPRTTNYYNAPRNATLALLLLALLLQSLIPLARERPLMSASDPITPESLYMNRRTFMKTGVLAATAVATGTAYRLLNTPSTRQIETAKLQLATTSTAPANSGFHVDEPLTSLEDITHYNNFYEFSTDKDSVADAAANFKTDGWKVAVDGLCSNPTTFDLDDLLKIAPPEERVYRMRCVEAWSMVIPWAGYSLSKLLERVQPLSSAKHVAFTTLMDPKRMPGQRSQTLDWPYVEGLRMDEAMHPLAILASGLYGHALPPQDGAPVRLVTPWKYGFKGIKSIVKISLVEQQPPTTWNLAGPDEYGFYANVNPNVPHPRWSQAMERRIGGSEQPTLMFNGYGEQVANLYAGMDLRRNY